VGAAFYQINWQMSDAKNWPGIRDICVSGCGETGYCWLMVQCVVCAESLNGRQTRFCSRHCKNRFTNNRHQSYKSQQRRGRRRKLRLIGIFGDSCSKCGYRNNFSALEFHHQNAENKLFNLDLRALSNRQWPAIVDEAQKCVLLCSNCHKETHNPECNLPENLTSKS
jgi:hypothetical protein